MDYVSKTYAEPIRDATVGAGKPRPHEQVQEAGDSDSQRTKVSRTSSVAPRVVTTEEKKRVNVS